MKMSFIVKKSQFNIFIKKYNHLNYNKLKTMIRLYDRTKNNELVLTYNMYDDKSWSYCNVYKESIKNNICYGCVKYNKICNL